MNVYRLPGKDAQFIKIFNMIATETSGVTICGGDWNVQLHPSMDSSNRIKKINSETLHIKKLLKEIGMIDVWKELYPTEKRFTFFSHPHSVYSRIDYFFMFKSERHRIINCNIGVKDISDHEQCCHLSDFVIIFSEFSDPFSDFFSKH